MGLFKSAGIIGLALIVGCSQQPLYTPVEVKVPVPVGCKIKVPARPTLALSALTDSHRYDETIRAYVETVVQLEGYAKELETALKGCNDEAVSTESHLKR